MGLPERPEATFMLRCVDTLEAVRHVYVVIYIGGAATMEPGIIGYCDPWSARPGQALSFMISSAAGRPFRARVVRVRHADPNPGGPGMKLIPAPEFGEQVHAGREQRARPGSFGRA